MKSRIAVALLILGCCALEGCYYVQAARGQLDVLRKREPITEVVADPATPPELADTLLAVDAARDFSVAELGLPDNGSYRSYADLGRPFVLWNVFAAPEFSVEPETWCYPIAGCVSYRGYFREAAAHKLARRLAGQGNDVFVGGVAAYSTLGRFDDPVLNSMLHWGETRLIAVMFHELAHQQLYIRDDTTFNESYASAVETIALERWLEHSGDDAARQQHDEERQLRRRLAELIVAAREDLATLYAAGGDPAVMATAKEKRLDRLAADLSAAVTAAGRDPQLYIGSGELNNARLASVSIYDAWVPAFMALYRRCESQLDCFYARAATIAAAEPAERERQLAALLEPG